jgi:hypothetical protein
VLVPPAVLACHMKQMWRGPGFSPSPSGYQNKDTNGNGTKAESHFTKVIFLTRERPADSSR